VLAGDRQSAKLSETDHLVLDFAEKLTVNPAAASQADIDGLRRAGFTDQAILELVLVVGYMNFVNRLALALDVGLEPYFARFTR
jgi:uncharacterized peroxidase-related enzyme